MKMLAALDGSLRVMLHIDAGRVAAVTGTGPS